jgi:hypothetical protein
MTRCDAVLLASTDNFLPNMRQARSAPPAMALPTAGMPLEVADPSRGAARLVDRHVSLQLGDHVPQLSHLFPEGSIFVLQA